jgi:hypothetical protein
MGSEHIDIDITICIYIYGSEPRKVPVKCDGTIKELAIVGLQDVDFETAHTLRRQKGASVGISPTVLPI